MNKFLALKRSQICIRLHACERAILTCRHGDIVRNRTLRAERADLLAALAQKDDELLEKFKKANYSQLG